MTGPGRATRSAVVRSRVRQAWVALRRWSRELDGLEHREPWLVWLVLGAAFILLGLALRMPATGVIAAAGFVLGRWLARSRRIRLLPPPPDRGMGEA